MKVFIIAISCLMLSFEGSHFLQPSLHSAQDTVILPPRMPRATSAAIAFAAAIRWFGNVRVTSPQGSFAQKAHRILLWKSCSLIRFWTVGMNWSGVMHLARYTQFACSF